MKRGALWAALLLALWGTTPPAWAKPAPKKAAVHKAAPPSAASPAASPAASTLPAPSEADDWLQTPQRAEPTPSRSPLGWLLAGAIAALGCTAGVLQVRRARGLGLHGAMRERIDLLAVRSLGGRQRLCLVEAAGERLLIAASEQEITLLSHLPGVGAEQSFAQVAAPILAPTRAATAPEMAPATPRPEAASVAPPPLAPAAAPAPVPPPAPRAGAPMARPLASADVEGLGRWRHERQAAGGAR